MHTRIRHKHRRGATMVETAFALPIVFLFFTGMIEISRVLLLQHSVDTAAYEGARCAMVPGSTKDEAVAAANALLTAAKLKSAIITVQPDPISETTALINVRIELPVSANSWITPFWFRGSVISEVTLITERPAVVQLTGVPALKAKAAKVKSTSNL